MSNARTEAAVALYQQAIGDDNYKDPVMKGVVKDTMEMLKEALDSGTEAEVILFNQGEETHTDFDGHAVTDHFYRIPTIVNGVGLMLVVTTEVDSPRMDSAHVVAHTVDDTFLWPVWASEPYWYFGSYLVEKKYRERASA